MKNLRAGSFNQCTHKWTQDRYQAKLASLGSEWNIQNPKLHTMHTPRIVGATTLFFGGCTEAQLKAKGRWSGDIAYIYARFCPDMDREAVRAIGRTDASPFLENIDSHWATVAVWTEDAADLGDADEFDEGDEALSDDEDED